MNDLLRDALAWLAAIGLTSTVFVGTAYAVFKYMGDKWLTAKFAERLEVFKHLQQQELERLRFRINGLLDRAVKLNQREFEVLPEIWSRMNDAYASVASFTHPFQSYPDLNRMRASELEDFLDKSELADWQKEELQAATDKTKLYMKMEFWLRINRVMPMYREFHGYYRKSRIFLEPELSKMIDDFSTMLWEALNERKLEEEHPNPRPNRFEKGELLRRDGEAALETIGQAVQRRLWDARLAADDPAKM